MAISEELLTSLVEAVAALNQRVNEAALRAMVPGPQGETGPQGEPGQDASPITDQQIKDAAASWLSENIFQPKDGIDGKDGQPGRAPTEAEIQLAVDLWFEIHRAELRGPVGEAGPAGADGRAGIDGRNGTNGRDGRDGAEGNGIALVEQREQGSFWITLTDGQEFEIELPKPKGSVIVGGGGTFQGIDLGTY